MGTNFYWKIRPQELEKYIPKAVCIDVLSHIGEARVGCTAIHAVLRCVEMALTIYTLKLKKRSGIKYVRYVAEKERTYAHSDGQS